MVLLLEELEVLLDCGRSRPPVLAVQVPLRHLHDLDSLRLDLHLGGVVGLGGHRGIGENLLDQGGRLGALLVAPVSAVAVRHLEVEGGVVVLRHGQQQRGSRAPSFDASHFGQKDGRDVTKLGDLPPATCWHRTAVYWRGH